MYRMLQRIQRFKYNESTYKITYQTSKLKQSELLKCTNKRKHAWHLPAVMLCRFFLVNLLTGCLFIEFFFENPSLFISDLNVTMFKNVKHLVA